MIHIATYANCGVLSQNVDTITHLTEAGICVPNKAATYISCFSFFTDLQAYSLQETSCKPEKAFIGLFKRGWHCRVETPVGLCYQFPVNNHCWDIQSILYALSRVLALNCPELLTVSPVVSSSFFFKNFF